jgi:hypothetical protein
VLGLVGNGSTFDSGGLSLTSPAAMQSMRLDVERAATVLAVMAGLRAPEVAPVTKRRFRWPVAMRSVQGAVWSCPTVPQRPNGSMSEPGAREW